MMIAQKRGVFRTTLGVVVGRCVQTRNKHPFSLTFPDACPEPVLANDRASSCTYVSSYETAFKKRAFFFFFFLSLRFDLPVNAAVTLASSAV